MLVFLVAFALLDRSNAPFVSARYAKVLAQSRPFASLSMAGGLPRDDSSVAGSIDVIRDGPLPVVMSATTGSGLVFGGIGIVVVEGWAVDSHARRPAFAVIARIDGRFVSQAHTGKIREDVSTAFGNSAYATSGFRLEITPAVLRGGKHRLSFYAVDSQNASFGQIGRTFAIAIAQRKGPS